MALLASSLNIVGVLLLAHGIYSAYEHFLLQAAGLPAPQSAIFQHIHLPVDITLETLASVLMICVGVVLSSPDLKPIQWSAWAGDVEKYKEMRIVQEAGVPAGNPYVALEERMGFWDVRGARKGFAEGVREEGK